MTDREIGILQHKWFDIKCQTDGCQSLVFSESQAEVVRLRQWIDGLQSNMWINCVYCGHQYGPTDSTPVSKSAQLTAHIEVCPEHPISKLKTENRELRAECEHLQTEIEELGWTVSQISAQLGISK